MSLYLKKIRKKSRYVSHYHTYFFLCTGPRAPCLGTQLLHTHKNLRTIVSLCFSKEEGKRPNLISKQHMTLFRNSILFSVQSMRSIFSFKKIMSKTELVVQGRMRNVRLTEFPVFEIYSGLLKAKTCKFSSIRICSTSLLPAVHNNRIIYRSPN
jgi:hypothetical protein